MIRSRFVTSMTFASTSANSGTRWPLSIARSTTEASGASDSSGS